VICNDCGFRAHPSLHINKFTAPVTAAAAAAAADDDDGDDG